MSVTASRDARLLAELARPLEPERTPFYVWASPDGNPDGWYWTPAGAERPRFLGRSVFYAERKLLELLRDSSQAE